MGQLQLKMPEYKNIHLYLYIYLFSIVLSIALFGFLFAMNTDVNAASQGNLDDSEGIVMKTEFI